MKGTIKTEFYRPRKKMLQMVVVPRIESVGVSVIQTLLDTILKASVNIALLIQVVKCERYKRD